MAADIRIVPFHGLDQNALVAWRGAIRQSTNCRSCLQTPEWFCYRWNSEAECLVALVRDCSSLSATPITKSEASFPFSIGGLRLGSARFGGVLINGNIPLLEVRYYQALFDAIMSRPDIECLYVIGIPTDSAFHQFLLSKASDPRFIVFQPQLPNDYYYIDIPATHEEYLSKFGPKTIKKIRYRIRALEKHEGSKIRLERITSPHQIDEFLKRAKSVSETSWQHKLVDFDPDNNSHDRHKLLNSLAEQGILRSYLMVSEQNPIAFAVGFQLNGIFYFHETAFDPRWSEFSPGQSLVFMILQDCFEHNKPSMFHFGMGPAAYKEFFSNRSASEASVFVMKNTRRNLALIHALRVWKSGLALAKSLIRRRH